MSTARLRWTRVQAGCYTAGGYTVCGKGVSWELIREDGTLVRRGNSKGELQRLVGDEHADACNARNAPEPEGFEPAPEPAPEPEPARRRASTVAPTTSLESVLASLRLELEQLTLSVRGLAAEVAKLAERGRKV